MEIKRLIIKTEKILFSFRELPFFVIFLIQLLHSHEVQANTANKEKS